MEINLSGSYHHAIDFLAFLKLIHINCNYYLYFSHYIRVAEHKYSLDANEQNSFGQSNLNSHFIFCINMALKGYHRCVSDWRCFFEKCGYHSFTFMGTSPAIKNSEDETGSNRELKDYEKDKLTWINKFYMYFIILLNFFNLSKFIGKIIN